MKETNYLSKYFFDWDAMELVLGGRSALDSRLFVGPAFKDGQIKRFLLSYGLNHDDPVTRSELFGNFQEALQFIRRYFLREGSENGLDLKIPNSILMITNVDELFLMAMKRELKSDLEEAFWAEAILKVMHTILHVDKDLRLNYFQPIQTQIFDRFYKYLYRNDEGKLFWRLEEDKAGDIPLVDFETKSRKTRDSVVIKLLHKAENVAEELFDQIGVRLIVESRFDTLRIVKSLLDKFVIIIHNIKPSRSINTLVDLDRFRVQYGLLIKQTLRENLQEEDFLFKADAIIKDCLANLEEGHNPHMLKNYHSIQFTCRQLVKYRNPFFKSFNELRQQAKMVEHENDLAAKILDLDMGLVPRDVRFFYPYEVQILDLKSHEINTAGEASHQEYKKSQIQTAMKRVFSSLIEYKNLSI